MISMLEKRKRGKWGSTIGFILATSGAAVGLGNVQRFPYIAAQGGGAAFVLMYVLFVVVLGVPLMLTELSLGRHTEKNPVSAIDAIRPRSLWRGVGILGILTAFFILTYYSVIAGWTMSYVVQSCVCKVTPNFKMLTADPVSVIGYTGFFLALTMLVVIRGIKEGIEKYSKIFMPTLLLLMIFLVIRSLSLPNSWEGITYYLKVDFAKLTPKACFLALGQAFFSLSIGEAVLITYGSYANKEENLIHSAFYIVLFDTLVALLSGFIIFPAIFSFGEIPMQGIGLTFEVLPRIFEKMFLGSIFQALFFLLLSFAAITTTIALLEMPVSYIMETKRWSRKRAVWVVGTLAFFCSIPSALSNGADPFLTNFYIAWMDQRGFSNIMDFIWGNMGMVIGGGLLTIFVGWIWGAKNGAQELALGAPGFERLLKVWMFLIQYVAPILIFVILCGIFWYRWGDFTPLIVSKSGV